MTTSKHVWPLLSMAIVSLGLAAPLRSESRAIFARPADGTHRQSTPLTQVSNSTLSGQSDPNSQTKSLSLVTEQAVPKLAQVTYDEGQLTIVAENVPLSAVLDAVRRVMGASIEIPPGAANQLIWVRSGPGPARKVLRDLLDGTELDYVIQASETDVDGVKSVLLTARSKGADTLEPVNSQVRGLNRRAQPSAVPAADSSEMDVAPEEKVASSSEPGATDRAAATSAQPTPNNVELSSVDSKTTPVGSTGGSSEHTIQQLQTLYQQRRQMQMQQNQKLPTAN
jgi:hypothetical protein